jgi:hypothetical protein
MNSTVRSIAQNNFQHENGTSDLNSEKKPRKMQIPESKKEPISGIVFDNKEDVFCPDVTDFQGSKDSSNMSNTHVSEQSSGPRYSFSTEIPDKYDDSYLCILPRTPQSYYVYWEQPDGKKTGDERFDQKSNLPEQWILRISELTQDNSQSGNTRKTDVPINLIDNDSYINIPHTIYPYCIECGPISPDGRFTPVASTTDIPVSSQPNVKQESSVETLFIQSDQLISQLSNTAVIQNIINHKSEPVANNNMSSGRSDTSDKNRYFGSASPI